MLSQRDESLKTAHLDVARLEREAEGFSQRLRSMDESEQRYKDENWSLETQLHNLTAESKEASAREHKLHQALNVATSEKNMSLRELDDLKQTHVKAVEDHDLMRKNQELELGSLRRDLSMGENEKSALQRKIEDLTSQNQELATAVAGRFRDQEIAASQAVGSESESYPVDRSDTEHSPPPSPTKGSQRHSMLESETLKSSLHHAHRMIQTLKGNVHREKSEKLDLKRMLQEARDELDVRRSEGPEQKRLKSKSQQDLAKKAIRPNMLGAGRNSRTDITIDEPDWVDHNYDSSPQLSRPPRIGAIGRMDSSLTNDASDAYQTANETEDGFETAHERDYPTENEPFQTGAENAAADSSDDMTETEGGITRGGTIRGTKTSSTAVSKLTHRSSFISTASTSAGEEETSLKTPNSTQPPRYRIKVNRGSRRSRIANEGIDSNPSTAKGSPASFAGNGIEGNQSLFAELGDINDGDSGEDGTPSRGLNSQRSTPSMRRSLSLQQSNLKRRRSVSSQRSIPGLRQSTIAYSGQEPPVPRIPVVDSGTMTEPWMGEPSEPATDRLKSAETETPLNGGHSGQIHEIEGIGPHVPQSQASSIRSRGGKIADSPSTPKSTPPRTVWDQPLSMFSNIIPTFSQTSNTTPLSAKSVISQDTPAADSPISSDPGASFDSGEDLDPNVMDTEQDTPTTPRSKPPQQEFSLSPIQGIESIPVPPAINSFLTTSAGVREQAPREFEYASFTPIKSAAGATSLKRTPPSEIDESPAPTDQPVSEDQPGTTKEAATSLLNQGVTGRIIGSIFGTSESKSAADTLTARDKTSQDLIVSPAENKQDSKRVLRELPSNILPRESPQSKEVNESFRFIPADVTDHGAQTVLSSEQIDSMIKQKAAVEVPKPINNVAFKPLSEIGAASPPPASQKFQDAPEFNKGKAIEQVSKEAAPLAKGIKRPTSSNSMRMSGNSAKYPPLPADHQQAIAAAAQRTSAAEPSTVMGPPLAPASAYRTGSTQPRTPSRPRTPVDQRSFAASPSSKPGTTPRARYSTMRSRISRRSSVSSFESELDERFNIRLDGMPIPDGIGGGTDPRMIQAITQTMIGEFLWKYTRKAGRGEMSNNRHRRFFWIHPYTRTLYWSDRDPSTAGRAELKAKSVAIEAVRVVADDNPMPPGLHRKSLVIITPGRSVKFTAQTSQRHETWFNALSYLLLRTGPEGSDGNGPTAEDLAEFNPTIMNSRNSSRARGSRTSLASWRSGSRTQDPTLRSHSHVSIRQPTGVPQHQNQASVSSRYSSQTARPQQQQQQEQQVENQSSRGRRNSASLGSRISSYWRPNRGTSVSSRTSQQSVNLQGPSSTSVTRPETATAGVYRPTSSAAGSRNGSADDLRGGTTGDGAGLENVRSCCDGESTSIYSSPTFQLHNGR